MDRIDPEIIVCQGSPRCPLEGVDAIAAQINGCKFCEVIVCHADGTQTVRKISEA